MPSGTMKGRGVGVCIHREAAVSPALWETNQTAHRKLVESFICINFIKNIKD